MPPTELQELRKRHCERRAAMPAEARRQAALTICERLAGLAAFRRARTVATYMPVRGEVDLQPLWQYFAPPAKRWYLPVVHPGAERVMQFASHDPGDPLRPNRLGVPEPDPAVARLLEPRQLDLVLTPLVAFDAAGHRIGMGAGYYDRAFAFLHSDAPPATPKLIGVAYEFQRLPRIEPEAWDVPLDGVITEDGVYGPLNDTKGNR